MHNGYNYRTLNPWEQIALEHLSAIIGEIVGAGFENPETLTDRISDLIIEVTCWSASDCNEEITEILNGHWNTPNNCDEEAGIHLKARNSKIPPDFDLTQIREEIRETVNSQPYSGSGEDGDKKINPSWGDSEEEDETRVPGFQDVDYESAYIYANRPDPVEDDKDDILY